MLVLEFKAQVKSNQFAAIDEAIRTAKFIRNSCIRLWMDVKGTTKNDLIAYEDLRIKNMVKNHCLAKSINDASWYQFRVWVEYFSKVFGKVTVAINPAYTSQECFSCGEIVKKSLSTRTHVCRCGCVMDRDHNAARNILGQGLSTVGHTGTFMLDMSNALGESTSTLVGAILHEQVGSLIKESPCL